MRNLLSILTMASISLPAFADVNLVPEPESLALFGIGVAALFLAKLRK